MFIVALRQVSVLGPHLTLLHSFVAGVAAAMNPASLGERLTRYSLPCVRQSFRVISRRLLRQGTVF